MYRKLNTLALKGKFQMTSTILDESIAQVKLSNCKFDTEQSLRNPVGLSDMSDKNSFGVVKIFTNFIHNFSLSAAFTNC